MLQQTQVATVIPYFNRFLETFPTLADLAAAPLEQVLHLWEGLGYYRRARGLHEAARLMAERHGAKLPNDPEALHALPGFGRYTVGAVLSQAYDRRLPIIEANTQRLLSRLFARTEPPEQPAARRWLWQTAESLLPRDRTGEFNQALMDLGSLVCTPASPRCGVCPLAEKCLALAKGVQEQLPAKKPASKPIQVEEAALVIRKRDRVLLVQRPSSGRWADLWEFPHGERKPDEPIPQVVERLARELIGLDVKPGPQLLVIRHPVTKYQITLTSVECTHLRGRYRSTFYQQGRWLKPAQLADYPSSSPQRKLINAVVGSCC